MNAPEIIRIPILPFGVVNAHLILGRSGAILVDAGLPGSEGRIEKALSRRGLAFKDVRLIVVTHAHVDHAGNAARLRELTGAPIVGHSGDIRYFRREIPMTFCPTGWAGRIFLKLPLIHEPYAAVEPDILLSNAGALDLASYGVTGTVMHTPGHTAGSLSVQLEIKEALVGDLAASGIMIGGLIRTKHPIRPPFEDDPHAVGLELERLLESGVKKFYLGHGGPLDARQVRTHAKMLLEMKGK